MEANSQRLRVPTERFLVLGSAAFLSPGESRSADSRFVYMGSVEAWKVLVQGGFFFPRRVEELELPSSSRGEMET